MITNFENYTSELTKYEQETVKPMVIDQLFFRNEKHKAITNKEICINLEFKGVKTHPTRVRKIIHEIRVLGDIKYIISTQKGYYKTKDENAVKTYLKSLYERVNSINEIRYAIEMQYLTEIQKKSADSQYDLF
jgi:hypothetical protein